MTQDNLSTGSLSSVGLDYCDCIAIANHLTLSFCISSSNSEEENLVPNNLVIIIPVGKLSGHIPP